MSLLPDDTKIAGTKTVADWKELKSKLDGSAQCDLWVEAMKDFFLQRLEARYFAPIRAIEEMKANTGEGFAVVTLQCALIEFFAATRVGKNYRYLKKGEKKSALTAHEYSNSQEMFTSFLTDQEPFKALFSVSACDFYANVRCGLFHEGRTKGGWKIQTGKNATHAINAAEKIIYRRRLQAAFEIYVSRYISEIKFDECLQKAFIRKFDGLCSE